MSTHDRLDRLASDLKSRGEEGLRLRAVERARSFKRSWVEMAEVLVRVRAREAYLDWGFEDFYSYCASELHLKRATVDKLTASYATLETHAPNVLQYDGVAQPIPTYDAVDYFARALRGDPANDGGDEGGHEIAPEIVEELRHAVFEEGAPVASLRRRFDPILRPTSDEERKLEHKRKVSAAAKRLTELLGELEGVDDAVVAHVTEALSSLVRELERADEAPRARRRKAG